MTTAIVQRTPEWHLARQRGIGASEASAVLGINPWVTRLELFLRKTGGIAEQEQTPRMLWGLRLQKAIGEAYTEETGHELVLEPPLLAHPQYPFMLASCDAFRKDTGAPVEFKRVSQHMAKDWGESGTDQVPDYYRLQCLQQMAVVGAETADVAALIGHDDFRIFHLTIEPAVIVKLVEVEADFMRRVAENDPPMPDFTHPSTLDLLNMIEPELGKVVELPERALELAGEYERMSAAKKITEELQDAAKAELIHLLGDAERGVLPDGRTVKRTLVKRAAHQVRASEFYKFTIEKEKGTKVCRQRQIAVEQT